MAEDLKDVREFKEGEFTEVKQYKEPTTRTINSVRVSGDNPFNSKSYKFTLTGNEINYDIQTEMINGKLKVKVISPDTKDFDILSSTKDQITLIEKDSVFTARKTKLENSEYEKIDPETEEKIKDEKGEVIKEKTYDEVLAVKKEVKIYNKIPLEINKEISYIDKKTEGDKYVYEFEIDPKIEHFKVGENSIEADLTTDLLAYYKMEETSGSTMTDSHGTNHGTYYNNLPSSTTGIIDNGQSFQTSGTGDYANIGGFLNSSADFTINLWIKPNSSPGTYARLFSYAYDANNKFILLHQTASEIRFRSTFGGTRQPDKPITGVPSNAWTMVTIVVSSGTPTIYKNTVEGGSTGTFNGFGTTDFLIADNGAGTRIWKGEMDELSFYSKAISTDEIAFLYGDGSPPSYPFEEPTEPIEKTANARIKINKTTTKTANSRIKIENSFTKNSNARIKILDQITKDTNARVKTENSIEKTANAYLSVTIAPFILSTSTNFTDGDPTTAQLTSPSGKDTDDFQAGKILDETNPVSLDLTANKYTELEWCIQATSNAEDDATYEFRITDEGTPIETYTQTPEWTIGTASQTIEKTSNARILISSEINKNTNSRIKTENSIEKNSNARIKISSEITKDANSRILKSGEITKDSNSTILIADSIEKTANSRIQIPNEITKDANAKILVTDGKSISKSATARIKTENSFTKNSNARLLVPNFKTYPANALIKANLSINKPCNAFISAEGLVVKNANASIKIEGLTLSKDANAKIVIEKTIDKNSNARIKTENTINKNSNARILKPAEITKTAKSRISLSNEITKETNSRILKSGELEKTSNARIKIPYSITKNSNARILITDSIEKGSNSCVKVGLSIEKTANASINTGKGIITKTCNASLHFPKLKYTATITQTPIIATITQTKLKATIT